MADNRIASDGTWSYSYDAEGNITRKTKLSGGWYWAYTYDHRNRLTAATLHASGGSARQRVENAYDARDRRFGQR